MYWHVSRNAHIPSWGVQKVRIWRNWNTFVKFPTFPAHWISSKQLSPSRVITRIQGAQTCGHGQSSTRYIDEFGGQCKVTGIRKISWQPVIYSYLIWMSHRNITFWQKTGISLHLLPTQCASWHPAPPHIIIIIITTIWHYRPLWVFAFSARSLQVLLSLAVSIQFFYLQLF